MTDLARPVEFTVHLEPRARLDFIDLRQRLGPAERASRLRYPRALYCSHHTTAGFLEQSLCARLEHNRDRLGHLMRAFQRVFPHDANYEHDKLHLREDLSEEQRRIESRNADSHLTFIGSGLRNCVTYANHRDTPVYLIDLDGVHERGARRRRATVVHYHREVPVESLLLEIPVSRHPIDSVNLRAPGLGVFEELERQVRRHGIARGRIDISLAADERRTGLTVNEYETLLMRHDLREVLGDPLRFMAEKSRSLLRNPRAIPNKTLSYAKYDLVTVLNELMDAARISESILERAVARVMAVPAERFWRLKRSVSLLVSNGGGGGPGSIVQGTYQSPILVQWGKAERGVRRLEAKLVGFE